MRKRRFKSFGPFSYFRVREGRKNFVSAWLTGHDDGHFGWEWGSDDTSFNPSFCLRIGHFNIFSYESFKGNGYILFVLGFWVMDL